MFTELKTLNVMNISKSIHSTLKQTALIVLCLFFFHSCNTIENKNRSTKEVKLVQETIDQLVKDNDIPGLNFSIINEGGIIENYSSGYADKETKQLLSKENTMFSGSIGKTYAVAVLMQLVEEGKIELNKKFADYFPEVEWLQLLPNINDITVEMLLQHRSGLPRYVLNNAVWDSVANKPDKVWTYKERLSFIFNTKAVHKPGEGWAYSDTNYLLIGMLIEKATNSDYYKEVINRIITPHKLEYTYPAIKRVFKELPKGYSSNSMFGINGAVVVEGKYIFNPQMEWTGGGFISTTADLARWAKLYYEAKVFTAESLSKIITPTINGTDIAENISYGMGSFIYKTKLGTAYGHTGTMPGFNSIFAYFPDKKTAIALQVNCDYAGEKMALIKYVETILNKMAEI